MTSGLDHVTSPLDTMLFYEILISLSDDIFLNDTLQTLFVFISDQCTTYNERLHVYGV